MFSVIAPGYLSAGERTAEYLLFPSNLVKPSVASVFSNSIEYRKQYVEMVGSGGRGLRIASIRWWMKMCSWEVCFRMSIPSALVLCLVVGFQIVNVVVTGHKPVDIETCGINGCRICSRIECDLQHLW